MGEGWVQTFLNPTTKNLDWHIFCQDGENLEHWIRRHAKGSVSLQAFPHDLTTLLIVREPCQIKASFTDRDSAILFKLQLGGRM